MRVRVGSIYRYDPVGLDLFDARTSLTKGDVVKVVNLPGCSPANTMRHCHVLKDGKFAGLVLTASLEAVVARRDSNEPDCTLGSV